MTVGLISRNVYVPSGLGHDRDFYRVEWSGSDTPRVVMPRSPRLRYKTTRIVKRSIRKGRNAGKVYTKVVPYSFTVRDPDAITNRHIRKEMPENPYSKTGYWYQCSPAISGPPFFSYTRATGSDWNWGYALGDPPLKPLITAESHNKMIGRLWSKIKGSDFNGAVFLGEAHQSIGMIADTAIRVAKSIWHIRKGDAKGALRTLLEGTTRAPLMRRFDNKKFEALYPNLRGDARNQASLWLEFQYGWRPLYGDTIAAAEMLSQQLEFPLKKIVRAGTFVGRNNPITAEHYGPSFASAPRKEFHGKQIKAVFGEDFDPSTMALLGLNDPELVAWELLPFSFVVDWFLPVGQYLETRCAVSNLTGGKFIISEKRTSECGSATVTGPLGASIGYHIPFKRTRVAMSRTITDRLVTAKPEFKPLKEALSLAHLANAIALVTTIFVTPEKEAGSTIQRLRGNQRALWG